MPSAKSGKAGSPVTPTDPANAMQADQADPGAVEQVKADQRQAKTGKYGSTSTKPYKPPKTNEEKAKKKSWIEIQMIDEEKQPVPGRKYRVTLPDGETVAEGTLDQNGSARITGIEPGTCKITFPDLDQSAWEEA